jgi:hypothetical protein
MNGWQLNCWIIGWQNIKLTSSGIEKPDILCLETVDSSQISNSYVGFVVKWSELIWGLRRELVFTYKESAIIIYWRKKSIFQIIFPHDHNHLSILDPCHRIIFFFFIINFPIFFFQTSFTHNRIENSTIKKKILIIIYYWFEGYNTMKIKI